MAKFENKKILITGGASGTGKIAGRSALERSANDCLINNAGMIAGKDFKRTIH